MWESLSKLATEKPELGLLIIVIVILTRWFSKQSTETSRQTDTIINFVDTQNKLAQQRAEDCHDRSDQMMERFVQHSKESDQERDKVLSSCTTMLGHCSTVIQSMTNKVMGS